MIKEEKLCCLQEIDSYHLCLLSVQVALIVAQHRDKNNHLSGIKLTALDKGLQRLYKAAKKCNGKTNTFNHISGIFIWGVPNWPMISFVINPTGLLLVLSQMYT